MEQSLEVLECTDSIYFKADYKSIRKYSQECPFNISWKYGHYITGQKLMGVVMVGP